MARRGSPGENQRTSGRTTAAHLKPGVSSSVRKAFEARLHPRDSHGRFRDVPGAGAGAAKPSRKPAQPRKGSAGQAALETSGVTGSSSINVLSSRVRKYRDFATVESFVAAHPKGRAYALRVLAADHKAGRIGFGSKGKPAEKPPAAAAPAGGNAKTSGVTAADRIEVLSTRVRKYRGVSTVGEYVSGHPKGRAHALRVLAADHKAGRIRFQAAEGPQASTPGNAGAPKWPGRAETRDIRRDEFTVDPAVVKAGLFRDEAHLREVSGSLLAGLPPGEPVRVHWYKGAATGDIRLTVTGVREEISLKRSFRRQADGGWAASHDHFEVPRKFQGQGGARRMLRASVEAYDRIGVGRVEVYANIDVGGYSWAKLGFTVSPDSAGAVRRALTDRKVDDPASPLARAIDRTLAVSTDDDLMWNLSRLDGPGGRSLGKEALLGSGWDGFLDLSNASHRQRLAANL